MLGRTNKKKMHGRTRKTWSCGSKSRQISKKKQEEKKMYHFVLRRNANSHSINMGFGRRICHWKKGIYFAINTEKLYTDSKMDKNFMDVSIHHECYGNDYVRKMTM